jgi:hypothetical protein
VLQQVLPRLKHRTRSRVELAEEMLDELDDHGADDDRITLSDLAPAKTAMNPKELTAVKPRKKRKAKAVK